MKAVATCALAAFALMWGCRSSKETACESRVQSAMTTAAHLTTADSVAIQVITAIAAQADSVSILHNDPSGAECRVNIYGITAKARRRSSTQRTVGTSVATQTATLAIENASSESKTIAEARPPFTFKTILIAGAVIALVGAFCTFIRKKRQSHK